MIDAIGRTLYRLVVSRRNLLEWVTAAQSQLASRLSLADNYRRMSASVLVASDRGDPGRRQWLRIDVGGIAIRAAVDRGACNRATDQRHRRWSPAACRSPTSTVGRCASSHVAPGAISKRSLAARITCCRRTTSRKTRNRSWRIARRRPISVCICSAPSALATSAGRERWKASNAWKRRSRPWSACNDSAATSTTGMTRATCVRWNRRMFPRSTVAIWPHIWPPSPMHAMNGCMFRVDSAAHLDGIEDAVHLARERLAEASR